MPVPSRHPIDWGFLADARDFYSRRGYQYIEVPWVVRQEITELTIPDGALPFVVDNYGDLAGSAEQSFVQMKIDKVIPAGKYQTITPCFRDDVVDELHQKHFMKLELIDFRTKQHSYEEILNDAFDFCKFHLNRLIPPGADGGRLEIEEVTEDQKDINFYAKWWDGFMFNPIELGSYGTRRVEHNGNTYSWNYGTGLAEPRFSSVKNLGKSS
jgi:hypothetical protein